MGFDVGHDFRLHLPRTCRSWLWRAPIQAEAPRRLDTCQFPTGNLRGAFALSGVSRYGGPRSSLSGNCQRTAPLYESSLRKQGPVLRGLSIGCGVWVPALRPGRQRRRFHHTLYRVRYCRRRVADPIVAPAARRRRRCGHVLRHLCAQRPGAGRPRPARWPRGDRGPGGSSGG
jgi:hypothetical protein